MHAGRSLRQFLKVSIDRSATDNANNPLYSNSVPRFADLTAGKNFVHLLATMPNSVSLNCNFQISNLMKKGMLASIIARHA